VFSDRKYQFYSGFSNFGNAHEKLQAREKSAAQAYALAKNFQDTGQYINSTVTSKCKEKILQNFQAQIEF